MKFRKATKKALVLIIQMIADDNWGKLERVFKFHYQTTI